MGLRQIAPKMFKFRFIQIIIIAVAMTIGGGECNPKLDDVSNESRYVHKGQRMMMPKPTNSK
jgi:hypothetical protein